MNVKETLTYVIDAFNRIKKYAQHIYDSADEDVKQIIIDMCNQEIKATQFDLEQYEVEQQQKGESK